MKRFLSSLVIIALGFSATAQDASVKAIQTTAGTAIKTDTSKKANKNGWIKGGLVSVSLTQVGNSNWIAAGGDKFSLSMAASLNAYANRKWKKYSWDNMLDVNYGLVNTTTLGVRKINDRLDFTTKFGYQPTKWKKFRVSALGQLRSQLTSGYEYDYFGSGEKRRNSGFFAPAYVVVAPGIEFVPNSWFTAFLSPAAIRWTIVSNGPYSYKSQGGVFNGNVETPLARLYGVNPETENRFEFGGFFTASIRKDILKNVAYVSKLDLYSNYVDKKPFNVDLFWTNQFKFKVNRFIQVSYSVDMLYDDDVKNPLRPTNALGLQVLSTLGVGFATNF